MRFLIWALALPIFVNAGFAWARSDGDISPDEIVRITCEDPDLGIVLALDTREQVLTESFVAPGTSGRIREILSNTYLMENFDLKTKPKDFYTYAGYTYSSNNSPHQYKASSSLVLDVSAASYDRGTRNLSKPWSAHVARSLFLNGNGITTSTCDPAANVDTTCDYDVRCVFETPSRQ